MRFVVLAWALSRLMVLGILLSGGGPAALAHWDGAWYGSVALQGYAFSADGAEHNVAFFPLLPLVALPLVRIGVPWPIAASAISNVAFLGALVLLHRIAARRYEAITANWCVVLACLLPPSLFCSVAYPQSLFLLCSAAALDLYEGKRYVGSGCAGALASAASPVGIPLACSMLINGVLARRAIVIAGAVLAFVGVGAFALFCALRFGDALAFVHAQRAWRSGFGIDLHAWRSIALSLVALDGVRQNIVTVLLVPLGALATLFEARRLGRLMTLFAFFALAVFVFSGTPLSVDRNAYTVVPLLVAFGAILRRVPPAGYVVLALSALLLVIDCGRFARFEWVAYIEGTVSATI
jgi:Mannosyltransferase (PIG-V)